MSFDRYMGKDRRKKFRGAKARDHTCRNHGSCPHCRDNRLYANRKRHAAADQQLKETY